MHKAVTCFVEPKCVAGKVKPPEEIGATLSHKTFLLFSRISKHSRCLMKKCVNSYSLVQHKNGVTEFKAISGQGVHLWYCEMHSLSMS